jgi:WD40 repeat protein
MSTDRLERRLPEVLAELSLPRTPDYVDDLLSRTARMPQRPGWTFIERWFPMSTMALRLPVRQPALRLLVMVAILAALVIASVAWYVGSHPKAPPLFGPARNGLVVTAAGGGIVTIDPATGDTATLVAGRSLCCLEVAPDGQHVAYLDVPVNGADPTGLRVAALDGKIVEDVPADLLKGLNGYEWAPQGDRLLLTNTSGMAAIDIGTGQVTRYSLPIAVTGAGWIGATGDILLSSRTSDQAPLHVYRLAAGASNPTEIATLDNVVGGPIVSPDGSRFTYFIWGPEPRLQGRVHVFDLASGVDTAITPEDDVSNVDPHAVEGPQWSPDGSSIAALWFGTGFDQIAIISASGGPPTFVGPKLPENALQAGVGVQFSPDGQSVLVSYQYDHTTWLLPVSGSPGKQVPWSVSSADQGRDWQRLAP